MDDIKLLLIIIVVELLLIYLRGSRAYQMLAQKVRRITKRYRITRHIF